MSGITFRPWAAVVMTAALAACSGGSIAPQVQNGAAMAPLPNTPSAQPFAADRAAAASVKDYRYHVMPARQHASVQKQDTVYPGDVSYYGGAVLKNAWVDNIFVNSTKGTFGSPNSFEEHLSYSSFMHVVDQYVSATGNNRYDWEGDSTMSYPHYTTLADNDMLVIVHHAAAATHKTGYQHIYNVFLPPGTDVCFTATNQCNASTTSPSPAFCAYHGSVTFSDIGHVLYTVQPYQDPYYCAQPSATPTPNGDFDNTYSTLSHEIFETITDPDPFSGWVDENVGVNGEVADLCAYLPSLMNLDGKEYYLQREYSNKAHGCVNAP